MTAPSVRTLMLHEHHGMDLLSKEQIRVPPYGVATTGDEVFEAAKKIGQH